MVDDCVGTIFEGSNGRYYTGWQVDRKLRRGIWRPCIRQREPDRRLIETADRRLLFLVPVTPDELPDWTEVRTDGRRVRIVDSRRSVPWQTSSRGRSL
ncbi:hypothetical protein ACLI4Z_06585 [Natrialbaceae archaeon A-arb3/5]